MTVSDVTVKEGDNATLACKAVGHPQPRIVWKREDGENIILKKSSRDTETGKEGKLAIDIFHRRCSEISRRGNLILAVETFNGETLHLVKLDRRQMGSYLCIASNDVPPAVSKRITLHVNCKLTRFSF